MSVLVKWKVKGFLHDPWARELGLQLHVSKFFWLGSVEKWSMRFWKKQNLWKKKWGNSHEWNGWRRKKMTKQWGSHVKQWINNKVSDWLPHVQRHCWTPSECEGCFSCILNKMTWLWLWLTQTEKQPKSYKRQPRSLRTKICLSSQCC